MARSSPQEVQLVYSGTMSTLKVRTRSQVRLKRQENAELRGWQPDRQKHVRKRRSTSVLRLCPTRTMHIRYELSFRPPQQRRPVVESCRFPKWIKSMLRETLSAVRQTDLKKNTPQVSLRNEGRLLPRGACQCNVFFFLKKKKQWFERHSNSIDLKDFTLN